jgi:hypothetical protein
LVYSFGFVLATGTCTDLSSSIDLVDPASIPDHWIFIGDCLQIDRGYSNVPFSIVGSEVVLPFEAPVFHSSLKSFLQFVWMSKPNK